MIVVHEMNAPQSGSQSADHVSHGNELKSAISTYGSRDLQIVTPMTLSSDVNVCIATVEPPIADPPRRGRSLYSGRPQCY